MKLFRNLKAKVFGEINGHAVSSKDGRLLRRKLFGFAAAGVALASIAPASAGTVPAILQPNYLVVLSAGGTADSSSLINAAISQLNGVGGGAVYLSAGLYYANIVMLPGVSLVGVPSPGDSANWGAYPFTPVVTGTTFYPYNAANPTLSFNTGSVYQYSSVVSGIKFANSTLVSGSVGIEATQCNSFMVTNCIVENYDTGVLINYAWAFDFYRNFIGANKTNVSIGFTSAQSGTPMRFRDNVISWALVSNIVLNGSSEVTQFSGGECSRCGQATGNPFTSAAAIIVGGTTTIVAQFYDVRLEVNANHDVDINTAAQGAPVGVSFQECVFRRFTLVGGSISIASQQVSGCKVKDCYFFNYAQVFSFSNSTGLMDLDGNYYIGCTSAGSIFNIGGASVSIPLAPARVLGSSAQGLVIFGYAGETIVDGSQIIQGRSGSNPAINFREASNAGSATIQAGTGSPSGTLSALSGSLFIQTDATGGGGAQIWLNTGATGTSTTTWTAKL